VAERFPGDSEAPKGPVTLVLPGANGSVRAYSQGSWYEHQKGHWQTLPLGPSAPGNQFLFPDALGRAVRTDFPGSSVVQVLPIGQGFLVVSTNRLNRWESGKWTREAWPESWTISQLAVTRDGNWWAASSHGLVRRTASGWEPEAIIDAGDRAWAVRSVLGVAVDASGQLWFASKAGVGCRTSKGWRFFEGKDGSKAQKSINRLWHNRDDLHLEGIKSQ
jgi:ligand-binding sensor domain-containing protein